MKPLGQQPSLDGLRALAIIAVVAVHAGFLRSGVLAVDFFFVLSGFLITTLLLDEHARTGTLSLRSFHVRRATRLVPALWLLLVAYVAWAALQGGALGSPSHVAGAAAVGAGFVANFFATAWSPHQAQYLAHLWSLAEEEQFYVVWPLLLALLLRRRCSTRAVLTGLGAVVAMVTVERWLLALGGASTSRIAFAPDTNLDGLTIGCAAAFARSGLGWRPTRAAGAAALAAVVLLGLVFPELAGGDRSFTLPVAAPAFPAACAVVIVFLVSGESLASRALGVQPLRYVGRASYGIYLWHLPLMHAAGVPFGLLLTTVAAAVSYRYVEAPVRRLGRRWTQHAQRTPAGVPGYAAS